MINRRTLLRTTGLAFGSLTLPLTFQKTGSDVNDHQFSYCLNTSTIMGQNVGLSGEIEIAARSGYDGIEIWMRSLNAFLENGGTTKAIKQQARDAGIKIESSIGFAQWIVDDEATRKKGLELAEKEMNILAEIGCERTAAPPAGATELPQLNLDRAAERYHELLEIGRMTGVTPQLELWGFSANLHKLGEVMYVASQCGHADSCILPDVYHIYKGGSDFNGLKLLDGGAIHMFHINDYPEIPDRDSIDDSYRVYPGDGIAPLDFIINVLNAKQSPIVLSLELFNRDYWKMEAIEAARLGLEKMQNSVANALAAP